MRRLFTLALVALAVAAPGARARAQGPPSQLGLSEQNARQDLLSSLNSGSPVLGIASKAFTALPAAARAAVVNASFAWMKVTVNSAPFKTAYAQERENMKPGPPQAEGAVDAELKRKQDEQAKQTEDARKMLAMVPAAQRAEMEAMLRATDAQMKSPEMVAMMRQQIVADRAAAQETYQADLKKWQEDYPANPLVLVARRLQRFLDVSADVDFSARTTTRDGKTVFVDSAYEEKPGEWKMCFRAGRDAVTAARAAATAWLRELPRA